MSKISIPLSEFREKLIGVFSTHPDSPFSINNDLVDILVKIDHEHAPVGNGRKLSIEELSNHCGGDKDLAMSQYYPNVYKLQKLIRGYNIDQWTAFYRHRLLTEAITKITDEETALNKVKSESIRFVGHAKRNSTQMLAEWIVNEVTILPYGQHLNDAIDSVINRLIYWINISKIDVHVAYVGYGLYLKSRMSIGELELIPLHEISAKHRDLSSAIKEKIPKIDLDFDKSAGVFLVQKSAETTLDVSEIFADWSNKGSIEKIEKISTAIEETYDFLGLLSIKLGLPITRICAVEYSDIMLPHRDFSYATSGFSHDIIDDLSFNHGHSHDQISEETCQELESLHQAYKRLDSPQRHPISLTTNRLQSSIIRKSSLNTAIDLRIALEVITGTVDGEKAKTCADRGSMLLGDCQQKSILNKFYHASSTVIHTGTLGSSLKSRKKRQKAIDRGSEAIRMLLLKVISDGSYKDNDAWNSNAVSGSSLLQIFSRICKAH